MQILEQKQIAPGHDWQGYISKNYSILRVNPLLRRIVDAVETNDNFTTAVWGPKGSAKSTLQRNLSFQIYGNWDLVYAFRVQTKREVMDAIEFAKRDRRFWVDYHGIPLKRVPLLDIDDKGTIFPSSEGNNKEMKRWHQWWQSIRTDCAAVIGSSPLMSDVRKRMRIGADAEIACKKTFDPRTGRKRLSASFWTFHYMPSFKEPEGYYFRKEKICNLRWPQLPQKILERELAKRSSLADMLRAGISDSPASKAQMLVSDRDNGLSETEKEFLVLVYDSIGKGLESSSTEITEAYRVKYGDGIGPNFVRNQLKRLRAEGVLDYRSVDGHGTTSKTTLGKMAYQLLKEESLSRVEQSEPGEP